MLSKKKVLSVLLSATLLLSLCACGNTASTDTRSPEEILSAALVEKGVKTFSDSGYEILACEKVEFYDYNGQTLARTDLYYLNAKGATMYDSIYGIFDGTSLQNSYTYDTDETTFKELREFVKSATPTEYEVTSTLCDSIGIQTYHDWWVDIFTDTVCTYLMHYMDTLKNPYTIEVNSVDCYWEPPYSNVWFTVNISAENSLGGKVTSNIGNVRLCPITPDSTDYMTDVMSKEWYYCEKEPDCLYAKQQENSFRLDSTAIQEYILENY